MVYFKEYSTSDTVVEFVAVSEERAKYHYASLVICLSALFYPVTRTMALLLMTVIFYSLSNIVVEESVTVIKEFGIQIKEKYLLFNWEKILFLDHDKIEGHLLQECIVGNSVKFHLSFIVSGKSKLVVVFKYVYPGLPALQSIYETLSPPLGDVTHRRRTDARQSVTSQLSLLVDLIRATFTARECD